MKVTKQEITFTEGRFAGVTVPKGQPVRDAGYRASNGEQAYWVEGCARFLPRGSIWLHDATYYGIVVPESDVEDTSPCA